MIIHNTRPSDAFTLLRASLIVPVGFEVCERQTVALVQDKGGNIGRIEICANPIGVSSRARNSDGSKWFTRIEWLSPDGLPCSLLVSASQLNGQPGPVLEELAKRGVLLNPKASFLFRNYLFESQRDPLVPFERTVAQLGFTDALGESLPSFVLPTHVLRPPLPAGETPSSERIFFQPEHAVQSLGAYRAAGTLDEWRHALKPFGEHPLFVFAAAVGLAGSFLKPAGEENGGFHIYGETSRGKTAAAQICASVMGFPGNPSRGTAAPSLLLGWNATLNAVEMLVAPHSGMSVALDEIGSNESGVNLYNAFSGRGKARMTEFGGLREQSTWSVLALSTGEHSMRDHADQTDAGRATDGSAVRMLDLPIDAVNDAAVKMGAAVMLDPKEMAPLVRGLQAQLSESYGTALPAFVAGMLQYCCDHGLSLEKFIQSETKTCHELLCAGARDAGFVLSTGQVRALNRLALVASVGCLAADDLLPFSEEQVLRAVYAVRDAWLSTTKFMTEEEKIAEHLQNFCVAHFHHFRVNDPRACPPTRGWPFFYFENLGLITFTKKQLLHAAGSDNLRAVTKTLRKRNWLRTNEVNHANAKLLNDMKGIVLTARAFQIFAEPVLGDFLRSATTTAEDSRNSDHV